LWHARRAALPLQRERAQTYLDFATLRPLLVLIDSKLISAHAAEAVERAFAPLVQQARLDDLRRTFALLSRVNRWGPRRCWGQCSRPCAPPPPPRSVEDMRRAFADVCKRAALDLGGPPLLLCPGAAADEEEDKGLVQALLDFKEAMET